MSANDFSLRLLDEAEEMSNVQWHIVMIERAEEAHGKGCGCGWCALGRALDSPSLAIERGNFKKRMVHPYRQRIVAMDMRHR